MGHFPMILQHFGDISKFTGFGPILGHFTPGGGHLTSFLWFLGHNSSVDGHTRTSQVSTVIRPCSTVEQHLLGTQCILVLFPARH